MKTILIFLMILTFIILCKNDNTYRQRRIVADAIHQHNLDCIANGRKPNLILYDSMEPYDITLYRLWDWGYTRILPSEDFELIKDYIKEK